MLLFIMDKRYTFDLVAELYDKARPSYPQELFEVLFDKANLNEDSKILEIGPGTGQATMPLARKGLDILAVELGSNLAKHTRRNLKDFSNVKVVNNSFEQIELKNNSFDLVYSATAFHWVAENVRYAKTFDLLKAKGKIGIISTNHVSDEQGDKFLEVSRAIYDKYYPNRKSSSFQFPLTKDITAEYLDTELFRPIHFQIFPVVVEYNAQEYRELLNTYSPTLVLSEDKRISFLEEIEGLINSKFSGHLTKHFAMSLTLGEKI